MVPVVSAVGVGKPSAYGKRVMAESHYSKGKAFLGAALLLRRMPRDEHGEYVVLHLLCQGVELILKALLLAIDFDKYQLRLKKDFGHDLVLLADAVTSAAGRRPLRSGLQTELKELNRFYSGNHLRYGLLASIFIDPNSIPSRNVLLYIGAVLRLVARKGDIFGATPPAP